MSLVNIEKISKRFGGLKAVKEVSLLLHQDEILGVIGPNGSGKTTLFNLITGFLRPDSGRMAIEGINIIGSNPVQMCRLGICRTFQHVKSFENMTVLENIIAGRAYGREPAKTMKLARAESEELLNFANLYEKRFLKANQLVLAEQKRLEMIRAIATRPRLLLLDEIMAGLNPGELDEIIKFLFKVKSMNIGIVIIEHVIKAVLELSQRIIVLSAGEKIVEGSPQEIINNEKVIDIYLGKDSIC